MKRNDTVFSAKTMEMVQKGFAAFMSLLTVVLMTLKFFSGTGVDDNSVFKGYIKNIASIEEEVSLIEQYSNIDMTRLRELRENLTKIRVEAMNKYATAKLTDATIMDKVIHSINGTRLHIDIVIFKEEFRYKSNR